MVRQAPPSRFDGTPETHVLPAGTIVSRVHPFAYAATAFNPTTADPLFGGSRFDSTPTDPYEYLYGGADDAVAIAETLLRDIPADDRGGRFLPKRGWRGRTLSRLETTTPLTLISLRSGTDLAAIGQDTWLTWCDAADYPQTRAWAHWQRTIAPTVAGLVWLSKREPGREAYIFFGDRCPPGTFTDAPGPLSPPAPFDDPLGFAWLRATLRPYRVSIRL